MNMQDLRNDIDNELNGSEYAIHDMLRGVGCKVGVMIGKINDENERVDVEKEDVDRLKQLLELIPGMKFTMRTKCYNSTKLNEDCHGEVLACFMIDNQLDLVVEFHGENCPNKYGLEIVSEGRRGWHKVEMPDQVSTQVMIGGTRTITIHQSGVPLDKAYFVIVYENLNEKLLSYSPECEFGNESQLVNDVISYIEHNIGEKL